MPDVSAVLHWRATPDVSIPVGDRHDATDPDIEERPRTTGRRAAQTPRRFESRAVSRLADDPDRPLHKRGCRWPQLSRTLSEAVDPLHHSRDRRLGDGREGPA